MPPIKFQWDRGNEDKNLTKHKITNQESETVFADANRKVKYDEKHSAKEIRYICIGTAI